MTKKYLVFSIEFKEQTMHLLNKSNGHKKTKQFSLMIDELVNRWKIYLSVLDCNSIRMFYD